MNLPTPKLQRWGVPVIVGIPLDQNSSYLCGPRKAPALIREALHSEAWNKWAESPVDLGSPDALEDAGDLPNMEAADASERIEPAIVQIVERQKRPVSLGGDHSITYPILRAIGKRVPGITLVHFDAHPIYTPTTGAILTHMPAHSRASVNSTWSNGWYRLGYVHSMLTSDRKPKNIMWKFSTWIICPTPIN